MRPLPPLPLVDGHLLMDNSGLDLARCPRLFELQFLRRRVLASSKAGRNFGSTLHAGLAVQYRQCDVKPITPEAIPLVHEAMRTWLETNPQPLEDFRNFNHACTVMQAYWDNYRGEPWKIIQNQQGERIIEASFALPFRTVMGIPVIWCGKIDTGIEDNNGVWSFDTKSAFQFGELWEAGMAMDPGQLGYVWALKQAVRPGTPVQGYIINGIRIRRPKKNDEYLGVAPVDHSDFLRIPHHVSDEIIDEWVENTVHLIEDIITYHQKGFFPMRRSQCVPKYGRCDMYDVCSTGLASRDSALESNMYEDNTWSPLRQLEE